MSWNVGRSAAVLALAVAAPSRADDGPELSPPTSNAPVAPGRAVLAVPGVVPAPSRTIVSTPSNPSDPPLEPGPETTRSPLEDPTPPDLPLDAPLEMRGVPIPTRPPQRTLGPRPLPSNEPILLDEGDVRPDPPKRSSPPQAPRRARFFGLIPAPARDLSAGRATAEPERADPAEETLKHRIERQAREAVGDRARSIEVRVVGKNVNVQARGVRFYQKRAVRKSLESVPALSGLRSTIEVAD